MAYPIVEAPYGLVPVRRVDGAPYNGAVRHLPIAAQYNANIGVGAPVTVTANGVVQRAAVTTTGIIIGVFMGCHYTDPVTKQKRYSQYWPAGTDASDAMAMVADDPDLLFKVAVVSGTTVMSGVAATALGQNMALVNNADSTATGNSRYAVLDSSVASTATLPIRVVDLVRETAYEATGMKYRELLVKIVTHQLNTALAPS